jgi:thiol-disulfide isomerase/thioredoxin
LRTRETKTKKVLLFETSNLLIQNSGATEIDIHIKKIKKDIGDTSLISYLVDKYELKNQLSNDLHLVDLKGNKTTLSKFIQENTYKVIYVDIWASWCAPCLEEFPQSKIQAERMENKNILFIYLSIDDEVSKWNRASKKNQLPDNYSFLIENKKTSKFLEKIDFSSIPRYLIFNKTGELEYKDAPRPSDERTFKILDGLLKNKL